MNILIGLKVILEVVCYMCDLCRKTNGHDPRCPYYTSPKANHYCSACGEGIYSGENYIENDNGEYRHYECFYGMRELLEWLGYDIKTMEDMDGDF